MALKPSSKKWQRIRLVHDETPVDGREVPVFLATTLSGGYRRVLKMKGTPFHSWSPRHEHQRRTQNRAHLVTSASTQKTKIPTLLGIHH
ncbi:uncharacterized protein LOC135250075 isoform X12 [Anguilla rostrata]|uniref:uncharacterized protein LOC135250075 isoform X12 n=1 Tax=Anguilla rostrata TaxID=7938 RepID=UPI0030D37E8A